MWGTTGEENARRRSVDGCLFCGLSTHRWGLSAPTMLRACAVRPPRTGMSPGGRCTIGGLALVVVAVVVPVGVVEPVAVVAAAAMAVAAGEAAAAER